MHEIFKGLLFLHGYFNAADLVRQRQHFEARKAALGHRDVARSWFGVQARAHRPAPCSGA